MLYPKLVAIMLWLSVLSLTRSAAQEQYYLPLISEVVVVADVVALRQSGALRVRFDETEKELRLDSIRLPKKDSIVREKAYELLKKRLVGKSVEVHVLGSQYSAEENWNGYTLQEGVDVRLELVAEGLARYCQGNQRQPEFELRDRQAKKEKKGIWAKNQKGAVPPCEGVT